MDLPQRDDLKNNQNTNQKESSHISDGTKWNQALPESNPELEELLSKTELALKELLGRVKQASVKCLGRIEAGDTSLLEKQMQVDNI